MSSFWPSRPQREETEPEEKPIDDVQDTGEVLDSETSTDDAVERPPLAPPPPRPNLQRNVMQPASEAQASAAEAAAQNDTPTDSLSLAQLRRIVTEVNRADPVAYDFAYADTGPHAEELDEWFVYQFWQWVRLNAAQKAFEWHWTHESGEDGTWDDADHDTRAKFVQAAIAGIQSNDAALRSASIGKLVYLVLGRWGDTAMPNATTEGSRSIASIPQLQAIKAGVECLTSLEGLPVVWEALRIAFELQWTGDTQQSSPQETQDELMNLMTIMYVAIQETLNDTEDMSSSYGKLLELQPPLVDYMLVVTSKLRWDEQNVMPQTQMLLLFWKSILLVFGNSQDLARVKKATSEMTDSNQDKQKITASPLDYHTFRQEVTSKYPAYVPPQPAIPLEDENTSLLPPLSHQSNRNNASNGILPAPPNTQASGASILHQPVHIATPAPSPPPSPAAGGKGGKKQNYQTNQNFPFMYPPLDATSNSAGGKGVAALHDPIVSRRWEGSDIPASILEAGELFSERVRMTRATRQLWEERERFLKSERGWEEEDEDDDDIEELDLSELTLEEREVLKAFKSEGKKRDIPMPREEAVDFGPRPGELNERDKQRLVSVEKFYHEALPHLQSLVIVLLRPIFVNVTAIVAQQGNQMPGITRPNGPGMGLAGPRPQDPNGHNIPAEAPELSPEEVDAARTREITAKAMSGILLMLLKWLRLSHVLKFEYFTQLLLDSNYLPLVLKLFAHQDVQQVVDSKIDRVENSFFQFCNLRSKFKDQEDSDNDGEEEEEEQDEANGNEDTNANDEQMEEESEDDAAPPPIKRQRSPEAVPVPDDENDEESSDEEQRSMRPEVDEMGCPVNDLPTEPITDFSWRNFFSLINCLRVMQKICKNKAHRNLLLVQYKSSTILRKSLRVPQQELRLYTLKLFKNQVPYCGRKWRQSNMRVITAVYLHCRPELRDEWLAGSDIDAEVDSALPLEQALRGLTHWQNVRRYPDKVAAADVRAATKMEHDFFTRELERLDMDWGDLAVADDGMSDMDHSDAWGWPSRQDM